jgi:hypothetical protein
MVLDPTLNGENMRFWLTFFIGFVFAHFLFIWHEEDIIQQLKAWSFRMWKNLVHTQSNSDTIARWSSITFFFIQPRSQGFRKRTRGETRKPWSGPVNFALWLANTILSKNSWTWQLTITIQHLYFNMVLVCIRVCFAK